MKKLALGVAVTAALFGGVANATITVDVNGKPVITPADTYEVYLSGSSAAQSFIEQLLTSSKVPSTNRLCDSTKTIYKFGDNGNGKDQNAYLCVLNPNNPALTGLAAGKANLLVYKRNAGGSAQGVNPVVTESAIEFLKVDNAAKCSKPVVSGGLSVLTCSYTSGANENVNIPDFGISDVDPQQFKGDNTPAGFAQITSKDVSKLTIKSAAAQAFGIAVSTHLRNALQEAQFGVKSSCNPKNANYTPAKAESGACMPSLDSAQIASIFAGNFSAWTQLKLGPNNNLYANATGANKPDNSTIHICRRVSGSGTQAQLGVKFLGYPCNNIATKPATDTGLLPEAIVQAQVHAMSSSNSMSECLSELDSGLNNAGTSFNNIYGFRWAIGIQGTEINANRSSDFRFIKIDGVSPTLANIASGKYKDWVELTFQYNKSHVFDQSEKSIVDEIIKEAGNPTVMGVTNAAAKHSWGQSGFLAVPQSFAPTNNGNIVNSKPVNPLSHGTAKASPNACRLPAIYKPSATSGMQLN